MALTDRSQIHLMCVSKEGDRPGNDPLEGIDQSTQPSLLECTAICCPVKHPEPPSKLISGTSLTIASLALIIRLGISIFRGNISGPPSV